VNIKGYWEQLIWLDPENWGGMPLEQLASDKQDNHASLKEEFVQEEDLKPVRLNDYDDNNNVKHGTAGGDNLHDAAADMVEDDDIVNKSKTSKVTFQESANELHYHQSSVKSLSKAGDEYDFLDEFNGSSADVSLNKIKNKFRLPSSMSHNHKSNFSGKSSLSVSDKDNIRRNRNGIRKDRRGGDSDQDNNDNYDDEEFDDNYNDDDDDDEIDDDVDYLHEISLHDDVDDNDGINNDLRSHWNLATYFPQAAAEYFYFIIGNQPPSPHLSYHIISYIIYYIS
jgi:hypothetical protein